MALSKLIAFIDYRICDVPDYISDYLKESSMDDNIITRRELSCRVCNEEIAIKPPATEEFDIVCSEDCNQEYVGVLEEAAEHLFGNEL